MQPWASQIYCELLWDVKDVGGIFLTSGGDAGNISSWLSDLLVAGWVTVLSQCSKSDVLDSQGVFPRGVL